MKCALCKKDNKLSKSHIIPEFLYQTLYDEKHRFHKISDDIKKRNQLLQKGIYERLLCAQCEQHISKYERYGSLVLNGGFDLTFRRKERLNYFGNIDYKQFKIFALSILWRAGVSKLDAFSQVKLGPHEEKLRKMVQDENPKERHDYPFLLSPIVHENEIVEALIVPPTFTRLAHHMAYQFVLGGIAWVFVVSSHKAPKEFVAASIGKNNELAMLPLPLTDMGYIMDMAKELTKQGKLSDCEV